MKQPKNIVIPFALFYCLLDFFESGCDDPRLFEVCRSALRTKCDSLLRRDIYSQLLSAHDPEKRARLCGQYMLACAGVFGDDHDGSSSSTGSEASLYQSDEHCSSYGLDHDEHCSSYGLEHDEHCSCYGL